MITYNIINDFCKKNNIKIEESMLNSFEILTEELKVFNLHTNITALKDDNSIAIKHHADSITPLIYNLIPKSAKVVDVGCGAGFPGLPLKILLPEIDITFIDSTEKKLRFSKLISEKLNFSVTTLSGRAEDLAKTNLRESFDVAVSRAVASLPILLELCLPFVKDCGILICYKSLKECNLNNPESELFKSKNALKMLSSKILYIKEAILPPCNDEEEQKHALVVIKKLNKCSTIYPRRYAQILKNPL